MNQRRALIIASSVAFAIIACAVIVSVSVLYVGRSDGLDNYPTLPSRSIKQVYSSGDTSPNKWFILFDEDAPMNEIRDEIVSNTDCQIHAFDAELKTLSISCDEIQAFMSLPLVQEHGSYMEEEIVWQSNQIQSNAPWGLDRTDQTNLPLTGTYNDNGFDGTGVDVHILDTGIYPAHVDFGNRVQPGYDGVRDGNATTVDCHGHGTHVAGTAAGSTYGFAKKANLYSSRILGCNGQGSTNGIISAIRWVMNHSNGGRRKVINMSLGGGVSTTLDQVVADAVSKGIVVVVAAGNDNKDACTGSPARAPSAITVMASDRSDAKASFSNYGSCADIVAPGVAIVSTSNLNPTGTKTMSGTSMACPHVAGVAALVLQKFPTYTPAQVQEFLISTSTSSRVSGLDSQSPNKLLFWGTTTSTSSSTSTTTSTSTSTSRSPSTSTPTSGSSSSTSRSPSSSTSTPTSTSTSTSIPSSGAVRESIVQVETGNVGKGFTTYEPRGSYYTSNLAGIHSATLVGPAGSDFDLYLFKLKNYTWELVGKDDTASSTKSVSFTEISSEPQSFLYAIRAHSGSGEYTLTLTRPSS